MDIAEVIKLANARQRRMSDAEVVAVWAAWGNDVTLADVVFLRDLLTNVYFEEVLGESSPDMTDPALYPFRLPSRVQADVVPWEEP